MQVPPSPYARGQLIPGTVYRVVRVLGEGGMGRVYEVSDVTIGKRYALKTVLETGGDIHQLAERLRRESRILGKLAEAHRAHPHIVKVITAGVSNDGQCFYVMEFLHGQPLSAILHKRNKLDMGAVVAVGSDIGQALHAAHLAGVVHRDVKPDNIFVTLGPHLSTSAKLLDFGVAGLHDPSTRDLGAIYGTLNYASPEQLRGEPATPLMDVWSLGCVLFEAATGRLPFPGHATSEVMDALLGPLPAPKLSDLVIDAPSELVKLVAWMLEKNSSRRMPTADIVVEELRRVQKRLAVLRSRKPADEDRTEETLLGAMDRGLTGDSLDITRYPEDVGAVPNLTATAPPPPLSPTATAGAFEPYFGVPASEPADWVPGVAFLAGSAEIGSGTQTAPPLDPSSFRSKKEHRETFAQPRRPSCSFTIKGAPFGLRLPYLALLFSIAFGLVVGTLVLRRIVSRRINAGAASHAEPTAAGRRPN
jgi:serine/threonine-protein kinase